MDVKTNPTADAIRFVADILESAPETLSAESGFNQHPKWDSLGHVGIMTALEQEFAVPINEETIVKYQTMENIVKLFTEKS